MVVRLWNEGRRTHSAPSTTKMVIFELWIHVNIISTSLTIFNLAKSLRPLLVFRFYSALPQMNSILHKPDINLDFSTKTSRLNRYSELLFFLILLNSNSVKKTLLRKSPGRGQIEKNSLLVILNINKVKWKAILVCLKVENHLNVTNF